MKVRIKRLHPNSVIPTYAKEGDAGLDLTAVDKYFDIDGNVVYHTGLAVEIPEGYVGLLFPRSSICKEDLSLCNSVGVIDSNYRGEIIVKFKPTPMFEIAEESQIEKDKFESYERIGVAESAGNMDTLNMHYKVGQRIAQLIIMPYPQIEFEEVKELTKTKRGDGGFGSTGR